MLVFLRHCSVVQRFELGLHLLCEDSLEPLVLALLVRGGEKRLEPSFYTLQGHGLSPVTIKEAHRPFLEFSSGWWKELCALLQQRDEFVKDWRWNEELLNGITLLF